MKKFILSIVALFAVVSLHAQEMEVGTANINKIDRTCLIAAYNTPTEILKEALEDKLTQSNIKKSSKAKGGFRVYKGVSIPSVSEDKIDLYTRVTGKKDNSQLFVAISKGYDNFITPDSDSETFARLKTYIVSLSSNIDVAQIKTDIAAQAKTVNKSEKEQKTLIKKGETLVSEMKALQDKLETNKKDQEENKKNQEEAAAKVQAESAMLEELKSKLEMMIRK